jgi:nucleotide-binding universal stress UspA family protein
MFHESMVARRRGAMLTAVKDVRGIRPMIEGEGQHPPPKDIGGAAMIKHILVPTDGSPLSTRAVRYAVKMAQSNRARVTVFHMIPEFRPLPFMDGPMPASPELFSEPEYKRVTGVEAARMLAKAAAIAKAAKVPVETRTAYAASPWKAIIHAAKSRRCDLIVMASHGWRGLDAVLMGSETTKVLTHSKIPVLVCR